MPPPQVRNVSGTWTSPRGTVETVSATVATAAMGSKGGTWRLAMPFPRVAGYWQLVVQITDHGDWETVESAPTVINAVPPACAAVQVRRVGDDC